MSMQTMAYAAASLGLVFGGSLSAAPIEKASAVQTNQTSAKAPLRSSFAIPPGQVKRPDDPDMGDDRAALRAILEVCYKETPAADRSAICDSSGDPDSPG